MPKCSRPVEDLVQPFVPPGEQVKAECCWLNVAPQANQLPVLPSGITNAVPSDQPVDSVVDQIAEGMTGHIAEAKKAITRIRWPVRIRWCLDRDEFTIAKKLSGIFPHPLGFVPIDLVPVRHVVIMPGSNAGATVTDPVICVTLLRQNR